MTKNDKPFKLALGLWLSPDFSEINYGSKKLPRINHTNVNFSSLKNSLESMFRFGPPVQILVPNDTIDQVTIQSRMEEGGSAVQCLDFGQSMLDAVDTQQDGVLDVLEQWEPLHVLKDRSYAPPPLILPFVVLCDSFEDSQIWIANCRPALGLPTFDVIKAMNDEPQGDEKDGKLTEQFRLELNDIFGTPFKAPAVVGRICMDEPPARYL